MYSIFVQKRRKIEPCFPIPAVKVLQRDLSLTNAYTSITDILFSDIGHNNKHYKLHLKKKVYFLYED